MAKIDELAFGSIVVEGKKYCRGYSDFCRWHVKEAESWAKERNLSLLVHPSSDAVARLNEIAEQKKEVAALIHITYQGINFMSTWFFCNALSCASGVLFHMDK